MTIRLDGLGGDRSKPRPSPRTVEPLGASDAGLAEAVRLLDASGPHEIPKPPVGEALRGVFGERKDVQAKASGNERRWSQS